MEYIQFLHGHHFINQRAGLVCKNRQTSDAHHRLMPPTLGGGAGPNNQQKYQHRKSNPHIIEETRGRILCNDGVADFDADVLELHQLLTPDVHKTTAVSADPRATTSLDEHVQSTRLHSTLSAHNTASTRMTFSRAHTSAEAADFTNLSMSNKCW